MKTMTLTATAALMLAAISGTMSAQKKDSSKKFIQPPVFLIMPGALTSCTISCPTPGVSKTNFNMRFQTVLPTRESWLAFVAGVQWGWFKDEAHAPLGFFGAIIPIVPLNDQLGGWLSVSFDPLGVTAGPGTKGTNLFLEGALVSPIGAKLWPKVPFLHEMGLYFLLDQQMTNLPLDANGNRDHWNPVLVYGLYWQAAP